MLTQRFVIWISCVILWIEAHVHVEWNMKHVVPLVVQKKNVFNVSWILVKDIHVQAILIMFVNRIIVEDAIECGILLQKDM